MVSQGKHKICTVLGCTIPISATARDRFCSSHNFLYRHMRSGGNFFDFLKSRTNRLYHDRPLCHVAGCLHGGQKRKGGKYAELCHYHSEISRGIDRSNRPIMPLVDYTLPYPILFRKKHHLLCSIVGCTNERKPLFVAREGSTVFAKKCDLHYTTSQQPCLSREKGICCVDECSKPQANKGLYRGKRRYAKQCEFHRHQLRRPRIISVPPDTNLCSLCGWLGPCDKHRLKAGKDGGGYTPGNIIVVCPNCHRLLHRGLSVENQQYYKKRRKLLGGVAI